MPAEPDVIALCAAVPADDGPGWRAGAPMGVVAWSDAAGAWMPDEAAAAMLPGIAFRAWRSRGEAIDGLRRVLFNRRMRGRVVLRNLGAVSCDEAERRLAAGRRRRLSRSAHQR